MIVDYDYHYVLPVGSVRLRELREASLWKRFKSWFQNQQMIVDHQIREDAKGELAKTMRGFPPEKKIKIFKD